MVRLEIRKLPGGAERPVAKDIAIFIAKQIEAQSGADLKNQIRDAVQGL
ncbi:MAG: hypothetical protein AB1752_12840 [Candidatus Zixiibacteriota bacterium]